VLAKEDKKNQLKKQNRKKKINHTKKSVHSGAGTSGNWALFLKTLSQLIGAFPWSETNAKSLLRH